MPEPLSPAIDHQIEQLNQRIATLRRYLPPEERKPARTLPPPLLERCPLCGTSMEQGTVAIRIPKQPGDFLLLPLLFLHGLLTVAMTVGLTRSEGWFRAVAGKKERRFMPSTGSRRACSCPGCGFVGVAA